MGKDTMSAEEFFGDSNKGKSTGGSAEPRGKRARKGLFEEAKTRLVMRAYSVSKARALDILAKKAAERAALEAAERGESDGDLMTAEEFFGAN